jgi:polyferredoxin
MIKMQTRLLHAFLSGIIIALVLGFFLIPATWQIISRQHEEPTFEPVTNGKTFIEIIVSVAVMAITLFSFKLARKAQE